ncbi:MAG: hypothetical protein JWO37_199 [Acidimicrobiales bacterium]|jgi:hypothetical protein|nr:hypothetical protein [Acidimicrobiales bacterium]
MRTGAPAHPLTCLVVGTDDWAIEQGALSLEMAGHEVARCHEPGAPVFPCRALQPGGQCPLDAGVDVVVTMRARPDNIPLPAEIGVICALHVGVPLVVAGLATDHPFAPWTDATVDPTGDLADACAAAAGRHTLDLTDSASAGARAEVAATDRSIPG